MVRYSSIVIIFFTLFYSSCKVQSTSKDPNIINGEILIDLKESVKNDLIIESFKKYDLSFKKNVSPDLNISLFKFNDSKISLDKLIKKVKSNENVENAQSNKKTTQRR